MEFAVCLTNVTAGIRNIVHASHDSKTKINMKIINYELIYLIKNIFKLDIFQCEKNITTIFFIRTILEEQ